MASNIVIPSNPVDIKKIKDAVKEASDSLLRMDSEREQIKAIADTMHDELAVPKNVFMKMVKVYHKQEFDKVVSATEDFTAFYETVMV